MAAKSESSFNQLFIYLLNKKKCAHRYKINCLYKLSSVLKALPPPAMPLFLPYKIKFPGWEGHGLKRNCGYDQLKCSKKYIPYDWRHIC
jgi:hypothetical protein